MTTDELIDDLARRGITDAYVMYGPETVHAPVPGGSVYLSDVDGGHPDGRRGYTVGRCWSDASQDERLLWIDESGDGTFVAAVDRFAEHVRAARTEADAR